MWSAATVLVCALELLGRSPATFPPIRLIDAPPRDATPSVEAFVRPGDDTISVVTSSAPFRDARSAPHRCGDNDALRKIASIIVHEEWHVRHGPDEREAYLAQLTALATMGAGAGTRVYGVVTRSMQTVVAADVTTRRLGPYRLELTSRTGRLRSGPP